MKNNNQYFLVNLDFRTEKQKEIQHAFIKQLNDRNLKILKIQLSSKDKVTYRPSPLRKMSLGNGWYCYYTDNEVKSNKTIFTMHGGQGNHTEWAGLQTEMKGYCRWINIVIPGMDGQDERRGDYDGSYQHFGLMILRLLQKLSIPKVVLCVHSFSSIFSPLLLTAYPHVFEGYINVSGAKEIWTIGLMSIYQGVIAEQKYYLQKNKQVKPWESQDQREKMYNRFLQLMKDKTYNLLPQFSLTKIQFFGFMKLINQSPQQIEKIGQIYKNLKIMQLIFEGRDDSYTTPTTTEGSIYNLLKGQNSYLQLPYYNKLFNLAKKPIQDRLRKEFGIVVQGEKIQQYFCFLFDQTGHSVHRRRPKECSHIIKIYLVCLQVIDECTPLMQTCL